MGMRTMMITMVAAAALAASSHAALAQGSASGPAPQASPQRSDAREPLRVVQSFYDWHLHNATRPSPHDATLWPHLERQRRNLAPALYERMSQLQRLVREQPETYVYDCDLLVGSQGGFHGYRMGRAKVEGSKAEVTLQLANTMRGPKVYSPYHTQVQLERLADRWCITDIKVDFDGIGGTARPFSWLLDAYLHPKERR